jgi:hypothetical protein
MTQSDDGRHVLPVTQRAPDEFEQRWLAEATRLREAASGRLDDAMANRAARTAGGDFETRLRHRAAALALDKGGLADALVQWRTHAALAAAGLCLVGMLAGAGMAASVLGDGQRPVNVVWALGGLLGLHLLTLLLWFAASLFGGARGGSLAGRAWMSLATRLGRRHGEAWLPEAALAMARSGGVLGAWLGRISHGLWSVTLGTALITMLVQLSTRRYGFVWETTILSDTVFVSLTQHLGALPAALGIAMPDADVVLRSATPNQLPTDRQLWAAWLISALIFYGLLPRLLLWAWCQWRWRRFRSGFRLDLNRPEYARLARNLMPTSETVGVSDAAPNALPEFHTTHAGAIPSGPHVALALELGPDLPWPPANLPAPLAGGRLDSREARRAALDTLAAQPVERLLIAVDGRLSPDRGALALIAETSRYAHRLGVWLLRADENTERHTHWRDALGQIGIRPADQLTTDATASSWLETEDD